MHERTPQDSENKDDDQSPEQEPRQSPRIYVASLADYNEGRLYGAWIDAAQDPDDLGKAVEQMLAAAPSPCAEEWAIHDYEGFGLCTSMNLRSSKTLPKWRLASIAMAPPSRPGRHT